MPPSKRPSFPQTGPPTHDVGWLRRRYLRRQGWLATVLVLQLLGGLGTLLVSGQEVFPLYSWFLFPLTPGAWQVKPGLLLLEYQGHHHETPLPLESDREVISAAQAPALVRLAQNLAQGVASGNEAAVRVARLELEGNFLNHGAGRYALVEVTYNPIERLHGGPQQTRILREFKIGEP